MNITKINDKKNMTFEHYNKQPMQALELRLNKIIANNPLPLKSPNKFFKQPLTRKYSPIPFKN